MPVALATFDSIINRIQESVVIAEQSDGIFESVEGNDIKQIKKILSKDRTVVHTRSRDGITPLHIASTVEAARLLLKYGAEVNIETGTGITPLFSKIHSTQWGLVSEYGSILEIAQLLIDNGAKMKINTPRQEKDVISFIKNISHSRNDSLSLDNLRTVRRLAENELTGNEVVEILKTLHTRIVEEKQKGSGGNGGSTCPKSFE